MFACAAEHHRQQQQRAGGAGEGPGRGEAAGKLGLPADQLRHVHQQRHARGGQPEPAQHQAPQASPSANHHSCIQCLCLLCRSTQVGSEAQKMPYLRLPFAALLCGICAKHLQDALH